jgi:uncharacterized paraquat-inducible protein A
MAWLATYSRQTVCPECQARIRLEEVRLTSTFPCPLCDKEIRVSGAYKKTIRLACYSLGLVIAYVLGDRLWLVMLLWILFTSILMFVCGYAGKYFLPPKLSRSVDEYPSVLNLGSKPNES